MSIAKTTISRTKIENTIVLLNKTDTDKITQQPIYSFIRKKAICNESFCTKFLKPNHHNFRCNHRTFGFIV